MITFDTSFTSIGLDEQGGIGEVPINGFLRSVARVREGVIISDTTGYWGLVMYQNTTFDNNFDLYNYLYPFTQINKSQTKKIEICKEDLQTTNSIPIELVGAPGIGLLIIPISMAYVFKYKSIQYNFADDLYIHCSTNTDTQAIFQITMDKLNAAASHSTSMPIIVAAASVGADLQFMENDSWVLKAKTSNATQGNSRLTIYLTYVIVEESWYDGIYCT